MTSTATKPASLPLNGYKADRQWSDTYLPAARQIVGPLLLVPAPIERDVSEATDLIVLRARDMTIGVRIRREGYNDIYPNQFTIRAARDSGAKTELRKIIEGWGDWLFYGHASGAQGIMPWMIIDLSMLRAVFMGKSDILHYPDNVVSGVKSNGDGTYFHWFDASKLPASCIVSKSPCRQEALAL